MRQRISSNICIVEVERMTFLKNLRQQCRCKFKNDLEDSFTGTALGSSPMRGQPTEISWCCNICIPFQVSGSVEMPSIFSAKETPFQKGRKQRVPRGLAESYWQSSTWPINVLYLSTVYYRDCAKNLQEEFASLNKIYIEPALLYHKCEKHFIFFGATVDRHYDYSLGSPLVTACYS